MASASITARQIGEKLQVVTDFLFLGSKFTADANCSHEIRRRLLLGRKAMTNLDSMLKAETLLCRQRSIQSRLWSSQWSLTFGCENWTVRKAERQRIDAFELWCWRRFLKVSWTARRTNQSILREINPEYSLGGLMLKLKLQYFGHLI